MTVRTPSRPFRSLGVILVGWVCLRAAVIMTNGPSDAMTALPPTPPPNAASVVRIERPSIPIHAVQSSPAYHEPAVRHGFALGTPDAKRRPASASRSDRNVMLGVFHNIAMPRTNAVVAFSSAQPSAPVGIGTWRPRSDSKPWSISAWMLMREDRPNGLSPGSELGGSQAGARLFYTIDGPVAATGRISRPLARAQGGEASVGIAVRRGNAGLLLERRIALDKGGRNDFSVTAYGGVSDIPLGHGIQLDGYAQGGVVGTDGFADGAVRIERAVATVNRARFSIGAGTWGGAQPGIERVDVGPQVVAHIPVPQGGLRVSAEWRERVACDAAPRSGPSLTIGVDF